MQQAPINEMMGWRISRTTSDENRDWGASAWSGVERRVWPGAPLVLTAVTHLALKMPQSHLGSFWANFIWIPMVDTFKLNRRRSVRNLNKPESFASALPNDLFYRCVYCMSNEMGRARATECTDWWMDWGLFASNNIFPKQLASS